MNFTHNNLPQWLQESMPQEVEDFIIKYDKEEDFFYLNDEGMTIFSTIDDAYNYVKNNSFHFVFDESVVQWCRSTKIEDIEEDDEYDEEEYSAPTNYLRQLQDAFYEKYDLDVSSKMITYKNNHGTYTALFENSSKAKIAETVQDIKYFEEVTAKAYHEHPNNFMYSYNFIAHHPMFWLKQTFPDGHFVWIDDGGVDELSVFFYNEDENDDNSPVVCVIETGEHVAPEYNMRYFSPLLTVKAPSYEQAIIKCAARLSKFYEDDGTAKEGYEEKANKASNYYITGDYGIEE